MQLSCWGWANTQAGMGAPTGFLERVAVSVLALCPAHCHDKEEMSGSSSTLGVGVWVVAPVLVLSVKHQVSGRQLPPWHTS